MASTRILWLFNNFGNEDYIGEPISILQHCLQAASLAGEKCNHEDPEFILAALLHDIGHIIGLEAGIAIGMNGCGIEHHEHIGADFALKLGFTPRIAKFIRSHVAGKRYLCHREVGYYESLTEASKMTLSFQGGPMTEDEALAFEADPDHKKIIMLRYLDEAAKDATATPPPLSSYVSLLDTCSSPSSSSTSSPPPYLLSASQLRFYHDHGYLVIRGLLSNTSSGIYSYGYTTSHIIKFVEDISNWPKESHKWLLHYELASNSDMKIMCRAENFLNYHDQLSKICRGLIQEIASQLFHEAAVLFKEKINFKLSGGAGFAAHQDTPAYIGLAKDHISCMIAIDTCISDNGCLQVAPGIYDHNSNIPLLPTGIITPDAEASMTFIPVPCQPGDVVLFNGYLPHRSDKNVSSNHRRAMFLTYNPASQGDHHEAYYRAKHQGLEGFNTGSAISFQKDFQGVIVD